MIQKGTYKISYPKPEVKVPPWYLLLTLSCYYLLNLVELACAKAYFLLVTCSLARSIAPISNYDWSVGYD